MAPRPPPTFISFFPFTSRIAMRNKHGRAENQEKAMKKHISDILLILCSVIGVTIIMMKIIPLHRKNSKVREVKKNLAFIEG